MPRLRKLTLVLTALVLAACRPALATSYTYNFTGLDATIPDHDTNGFSNSQLISDTLGNITDISVTLNISNGYNGDLYAYLVGPNSGFAVLLNRVGKTANNGFGYSDPGFHVTLDDQAGTDIHLYSPHNTGSPLTGLWAVDGRRDDPNDVTESIADRTALLSSFDGFSANGTWTLFLADLSIGEESTLMSWGLEISTVPEPGICTLGILAALALVFKMTRWGPRRIGD